MVETQKSEIHNFNEKPNSYEFGPAKNRFKIYFENNEDLRKLLSDLKDLIEKGEEII